MKLIIIAALNRKRVIGKNGKIPWHIPEDLQRFKDLTSHHTVLMGRKTYDSIGKPLPNRRNVVVSRVQKPGNFNSVEFFSSLDSALSHLATEEKVFIIGGGEIFNQTVKMADELLLTIVDNDSEGDVFFPEYENVGDIIFENIAEDKRSGYELRTLRRKKKE